MSDIEKVGDRKLYEICDDLAIYQETLEYVDQQLSTAPTDALLLEQRREIVAGRDKLAAELVGKTDSTAHVLRTLRHEDEVILAEEERRIHARRKRVQAALVWLKGYVMDVMRNRGIKAIKTPLATIRIQKNGGMRELVIDDPAAVPDELKMATVMMPLIEWKEIVDLCSTNGRRYQRYHFSVVERVSNEMVRAELKKKCWACSGSGKEDCEYPQACTCCGGDGEARVPGAHLAEQSESLRIS